MTSAAAARATFVAALAAMAAGCAALRPATVPAEPPRGQAAACAATRAGFVAVYDGEMNIWFHSFKAIWYVAVAPGGTNLSVAMLSPVGIKIMQVQGARENPSCTVSMPAAERLKPYGEAVWTGLLWALADGVDRNDAVWVRDGDRTLGEAKRGTASVCYEASAAGEIVEKTVSQGRRTTHEISLGETRREADRECPGLVRIKCRSPRCSLTLKLKSLHWSGKAAGGGDAVGP